MEMSSARTAGLILIVLCLAVSSAAAQQQKRGKPPAKTAGAEAKDPREEAAELYEAGQSAHQKGELEKAVGLYGDALERDPSLWQAEFQRAAAYFSLTRPADAKASILRALKQLSEFGDAPEARGPSSRAHIMLGEIALAGNDHVEAEKSFRRALELNPQAARARRSGRSHAGRRKTRRGDHRSEGRD
jgi:tetratricopeptide (TPR) repeat protein